MASEYIQSFTGPILAFGSELIMKLCTLSLALSSLTALISAQDGPYIADTANIPPDENLNNLPNNSLYFRWRQTYHVQPPGGHMNDPCGPMYDPNKGLYHIFYQSFPQHVAFGNTSWSHATSPDLVDWTDVGGWENRSMVAIPTGPFPQYDWIGAFSGGAQPVNLQGENDGNLTLMYTGASKFPDNWKVPYRLGTEKQALATSSDGGETWQKYEGNPVIDGAPGGWNVTGLRDPLFAKNTLLDTALGYEVNSSWYLTMGSGIRGVGPRIPLYRAPANDLTNWTFLGGLYELGNNYSFGGNEYVTGNHGYNYEMASLFNLPEREENGGDGETSHWAITFGAEGNPTDGHPLSHWTLWSMGNITRRENGSAQYDIQASGVLDWVNNYAMNQFYDPVKDRRLIWGWIDEDLNTTGIKAQGFQGSLGLPRELFVLVNTNVVAPEGGPPNETDAIWTENSDGTYTVKTMGQRPALDVVDGIQGNSSGTQLDDHEVTDTATILDGVNSTHFHLQFTVPSVPEDCQFSILLRTSLGFEEYTNITYLPSNSSVIMDRTHSTLLPDLLMTNFLAHFTPYTRPAGNALTKATNSSSQTTTDPLTISLFIDGSLFELFINDRFAMSSRTYPSRADATYIGFEGQGDGIVVTNITLWDQMRNIWPERPANASSPLVFDGYCETHVCFPNPYVDEGFQIYDGYKFV